MSIPKTSPRRLTVAIGCFFLGLIWAMVAFNLWKTRQDYWLEAQSRVEIQAQAFSEYTLASIQRIDGVLNDVCEEWRNQGHINAQWVNDQQQQLSDLSFQISVIDRDGKIVLNNEGSLERSISVRDSDYFLEFYHKPAYDHLYISAPIKDRVTGAWAVAFVRPVYRKGQLEGLVSPSVLANFAVKLGFKPRSVVAIIRDSGEILGRYPFEEKFLNQMLKGLIFFQPGSPNAGHFSMVSQTDGEERLFGYSKLPAYGITSTLGESFSSILERYVVYRRSVLIGAALLSLCVCGIFVVLYRSLKGMEVMQQQLESSKRQAEAANAAKSNFLATMSHEIRTPINGVVGMTSLLLDDDLTESQRKKADIIASSANALLLIVTDILDFSKIEAGKFDLEMVDFNLRDLLNEVAQLYALKSHEKSLAFTQAVDRDVPQWVCGDPTRVRQVLDNLLSNALKFTSAGEVRLLVSYHGRSNDSEMIHFQVSDTGIGISAEAQKKLFSVFEQADTSTTRRFGGTGLGLAICKQIVELMKGRIGVQTNQNNGTTFWFMVPLKLGQPVEAKPLVVKKIEPAMSQWRILLAEDNPTNQLIAQGMLHKLGYQRIDIAEDGLQVLEMVKDQHYDLILMDCHMPQMNGFQATEQLRDQGFARPIIAITANAVKGDREACLASGMDDYLAKPLTLESLGKMLTHWLEHTASMC